MPSLLIIIGSTRPGRVGLPIARWFQERAIEHGGFAVELVDLAEQNLPFMDEPNHPRLHQYTHQHTKDWSARVEAADAFVFVTPEYNHGYNAPLKNAIDYLHAEWQFKPVGFVSYGGVAAGTRAVEMLKQVVTVLYMMPSVAGVTIPGVRDVVNERGQVQATNAMTAAAKGMLDELLRWEAALRPLRGGDGRAG
jgi:NAD(P)H-dependent FMN reductase